MAAGGGLGDHGCMALAVMPGNQVGTVTAAATAAKVGEGSDWGGGAPPRAVPARGATCMAAAAATPVVILMVLRVVEMVELVAIPWIPSAAMDGRRAAAFPATTAAAAAAVAIMVAAAGTFSVVVVAVVHMRVVV